MSEDDVELVNPLPELPDDPEGRPMGPTYAELYGPSAGELVSVLGPVGIPMGLLVWLL